MHSSAIQRLEGYCKSVPEQFSLFSESQVHTRPAPEKWSKKEILGHLIDSAANNLQRFVRVQFEDTPTIRYDQNNWNRYSYYQEADTQQLLACWAALNQHLAALAQRIPEAALGRLCEMGEATPVTLAWLIDDYVGHLEHHLRQMGIQV
jgi:hypothetical protein